MKPRKVSGNRPVVFHQSTYIVLNLFKIFVNIKHKDQLCSCSAQFFSSVNQQDSLEKQAGLDPKGVSFPLMVV